MHSGRRRSSSSESFGSESSSSRKSCNVIATVKTTSTKTTSTANDSFTFSAAASATTTAANDNVYNAINNHHHHQQQQQQLECGTENPIAIALSNWNATQRVKHPQLNVDVQDCGSSLNSAIVESNQEEKNSAVVDIIATMRRHDDSDTNNYNSSFENDSLSFVVVVENGTAETNTVDTISNVDNNSGANNVQSSLNENDLAMKYFTRKNDITDVTYDDDDSYDSGDLNMNDIESLLGSDDEIESRNDDEDSFDSDNCNDDNSVSTNGTTNSLLRNVKPTTLFALLQLSQKYNTAAAAMFMSDDNSRTNGSRKQRSLQTKPSVVSDTSDTIVSSLSSSSMPPVAIPNIEIHSIRQSSIVYSSSSINSSFQQQVDNDDDDELLFYTSPTTIVASSTKQSSRLKRNDDYKTIDSSASSILNNAAVDNNHLVWNSNKRKDGCCLILYRIVKNTILILCTILFVFSYFPTTSTNGISKVEVLAVVQRQKEYDDGVTITNNHYPNFYRDVVAASGSASLITTIVSPPTVTKSPNNDVDNSKISQQSTSRRYYSNTDTLVTTSAIIIDTAIGEIRQQHERQLQQTVFATQTNNDGTERKSDDSGSSSFEPTIADEENDGTKQPQQNVKRNSVALKWWQKLDFNIYNSYSDCIHTMPKQRKKRANK